MALSVSRNTIQTRVQKMIKAGVLDIVGRIDSDTIPNHQIVVIGAIPAQAGTFWPIDLNEHLALTNDLL
ncbi:MAG: hypothetical protein JRI95_08700 [Deltaproteobacteria bacterium]|nr:hypothetical protein [Deltaproteobacteria bacterium]MBW2084477.1 hypothetical protein [Deltaproteobacteria bacterium]